MQLGDKVLFCVPFERVSFENQKEFDRLAIIIRIYPREKMANGELAPEYVDLSVFGYWSDRTHPLDAPVKQFEKVTQGEGIRQWRYPAPGSAIKVGNINDVIKVEAEAREKKK